MRKASRYRACFDLGWRRTLFCLRDDRREVFYFTDLAGNVAFGIESGRAGCPKPVSIFRGFERRHDAVGRHQNRAVERFEFLALLPPGVTVVADEVRIFFECPRNSA